MGFVVPLGWEQDSQTLYLHGTGVRIERMIYRKKEGWVLVPVDLDRAVVEFPPTSRPLEPSAREPWNLRTQALRKRWWKRERRPVAMRTPMTHPTTRKRTRRMIRKSRDVPQLRFSLKGSIR